MKRLKPVLIIVVPALWTFIIMAQDNSQAHKLQEAIDMMQTKGDYGAAIRLFEDVAKGPDRSLTARSLLYVGFCYEELGQKEAIKAYQRLIREYADQIEAAAEARLRLAPLVRAGSDKKTTAMVARRFWSGPELFFTTSLSTDGHNIFFTDWETGDLAVLEIATGKKRRLTATGAWFHPHNPGEWGVVPVPSPDGTQVAYVWYNKDQSCDLRLVRLDGTGSRLLCHHEEGNDIEPFEWSSDGTMILALFSGKDRTSQIVSVSVNDGSLRVLKTLQGQTPQKLSLSPDGRYVIYDLPQEKASEARDIFLIAADGSYEIPLVQHSAHDRVLGWAPDGKRILFASDRTGTTGLWVMDVVDGQPQGSPELIKPNLGPIWPIALTLDGRFYYAVVDTMTDVYIAELDPATSKVLAPAKKVTQPFVGTNRSPDWSPDGKNLVYITETVPYDSRWLKQAGEVSALSILSLETGQHRQLQLGLDVAQNLRWSPDGGSFLAAGGGPDHPLGFYRIDAQTGAFAFIMDVPIGSRQVEWSPDGSAIFCKFLRRPLFLRELKTGQEREIFPDPGAVMFALSPNGQSLALVTHDLIKGKVSVQVMASAGGEPHELMRLQLPEYISAMDWMADGQGLLFTKGRRDHLELPHELWRISLKGGEPQRLELAMDIMEWGNLRVDPTGRRIAYSSAKYRTEIWVMENFLPKLQGLR